MSSNEQKATAKIKRLRERAKKRRHHDKALQRERRKLRDLWAQTVRQYVTGGEPAEHLSLARERRHPPGSKNHSAAWGVGW